MIYLFLFSRIQSPGELGKKKIICVMSRNVANKKNADMHKLHFFKYSVVTGSEMSNPHRMPCLNLD